jgi:PhnB protein
MTTINPYLGFDGQCREAMTFYQSCFGGNLEFQTFGESPMAGECPAGKEGQILHSSLKSESFLIMATDMTPPEGFVSGSEISLAVGFDSEAEIKKVYGLLKNEGQLIDELKVAFWGGLFGVVRDKFGKVWMLEFSEAK